MSRSWEGFKLITKGNFNVNLLQDDTKFIVVAITSNELGRTSLQYDEDERIQDSSIIHVERVKFLAVFMSAFLKECSCSLLLIAG